MGETYNDSNKNSEELNVTIEKKNKKKDDLKQEHREAIYQASNNTNNYKSYKQKITKRNFSFSIKSNGKQVNKIINSNKNTKKPNISNPIETKVLTIIIYPFKKRKARNFQFLMER